MYRVRNVYAGRGLARILGAAMLQELGSEPNSSRLSGLSEKQVKGTSLGCVGWFAINI